MSKKKKKALMQFVKSSLILISALYIFIVQSCIPAYSSDPTCSGSTLVCPAGQTAVCSGGRVGTPVCNSLFGPSCQTTLAIFPGSVTCVTSEGTNPPPNNSSSSSGSSCVTCPLKPAIINCPVETILVKKTCTQCEYCKPIVCSFSPPPCPTPPNCTYTNIPKDENGCPKECGTLVCTSSSSSGGLTCDPDGIQAEIYNRIKNYTGKTDFPADFKLRLLDERFGFLKSLLYQLNVDRANAIRNAIYLIIGTQVNNGVVSAEFKASVDPLLLNLVNYSRNCTTPPTDDECSTALESITKTSTRVLEETNENIRFSVVPIPLTLPDTLNPFNRLAEIANKLAVADQRLRDLNRLLAALSAGLVYDADPTTPGIQVISGLNTPQNPNGAGDINVVKKEILRTKAYKCQLITTETFWKDLISKIDCLIVDSTTENKIISILNGERLVTALILGQSLDTYIYINGIRTIPDALRYLDNARAGLTFDPACIANLPPSNNSELITKFEELAPPGSIVLGRVKQDEETISHINKFSIIPIPLDGAFSSDSTISQRLVEITNKLTYVKTRINDLSGLLAALYAGINYDADLSIPGNQVVSGLNGTNDANIVFYELTRARGFLRELNKDKEFWTSIQSQETCLNRISTYINVLKKNAFDYAGLIGALILGQDFDWDPNTPGTQAVPGLNTPENPNGAKNYFLVNSKLNKARKDIKDLAANCGGGIVPDTCGSAICKNGEVCIIIDPCRGRPGCSVPIAQFCALPNASPFCTNDSITCKAGTPVCSNNKIPICGSSLGFANDLSGPGCTDSSRTTLSVNSAYCSTSNFRIPDEDKSSCTTKRLCPIGKRYESCREDRHNCECVCSFNTRSNKGTPRCDKHNNALCSRGLTPTCLNPDNTATCHGRKLICTNRDDGSIDLNDTIECK